MELLVFSISLLLILGAVLFLIVEIYAVVIGHIAGAPFVRSKKEKIKTMMDLAGLKPGEVAVDLGSGDGSLIIEAARQGARATGIEINPFLCWYSLWRIKKAGLQDRAKIIRGNFYHHSLKDADAIFLYLWPSTIEKLKEKLSRELKPEARIVSNGFPIRGWNPIMEKGGVYLYRPV